MFQNTSKYRLVQSKTGAHTFSQIQSSVNKPAAALYTPSVKETTGVLQTNNKRIKEVTKPQSYKEESFYANNYNTVVYPQQVNFTSPISPQQNFTTFLEAYVNTRDPVNLRYKYRDIYYFDNICGTAVDLRSELPFSEFTVTGISDPTILQKYKEATEELNPLQLLRKVLVDYFVNGVSAYHFLFDDVRKLFSSPIPLDLDRCKFIATPLLNDAPFINYQKDDQLSTFISNYKERDPRVVKYVQQRPSLLKLIASSDDSLLKLDPESTLYLERNDLSYSPGNNVSYYSRVLKYYEYEKRLFRGTLDLAEKRLKSILHIAVGNDTILPNSETLAEISNAFKTANLDPTDAIVATHNYVQTNELRQPTDFWRWDESSEFINRGKMVALGINEQFLSGEMSYASMESALSVFLEQLLWDRTYVTDKVFYKLLFPYIARENNFIVKDQNVKQHISKEIVLDPLLHEQKSHKKIQYQIPTITWHKTLKPKVDKEWLDTLAILKDQGIPVPFRMWITAAGINVDELASEYEVTKEDALETKANTYKENFELGEDYSKNFEDSDFESEDAAEVGVEEDIFKDTNESLQGLEAEQELEESPATKAEPITKQDNPQLFQGASVKALGLKVRKQLGDLNSIDVQTRLLPTVTDGHGKKRPMSKRELANYDEKANKILAEQLALKDEKDVYLTNKQYQDLKN